MTFAIQSLYPFWLLGLSQTKNLLRIHNGKYNTMELHHSAGLEEANLKIAALKRIYYTMLRKQSNLAVTFGEGKGGNDHFVLLENVPKRN